MQPGNTFSKEDLRYLGWINQPTKRNLKEKNWPQLAKRTDDPLPLSHNIIKANRAITRAQARAMASIQENEEPASQNNEDTVAVHDSGTEEEISTEEIPDLISDIDDSDDDQDNSSQMEPEAEEQEDLSLIHI